MVAMLRTALNQQQVLRIDSAYGFLTTTETAVRASHVHTLIRGSPMASSRRPPMLVEQVYSEVHIRSNLLRRTNTTVIFMVHASKPFSVVVTAVSEIDFELFLKNFSGAENLFNGCPTTEHASGSKDIEVRVNKCDETVAIAVIESISLSQVLFLVKSSVKRHILFAHNKAYDIGDIFGQNEGDSECVVCLTNQKVIVLMPCHHLCICAECNRMIDRCPVCRAPIQNFLSPEGPAVASRQINSPVTAQIPCGDRPAGAEMTGSEQHQRRQINLPDVLSQVGLMP